jgi:hypothetical protein
MIIINMELSPQNELNMLKNFIDHLPNGPEKNRRKELYRTKKRVLNNKAANAFLLSEFGSKNGRTRSTAQTLKFVPPMPTSPPPPPPKRKGGRRKRKTMKRRKTHRR